MNGSLPEYERGVGVLLQQWSPHAPHVFGQLFSDFGRVTRMRRHEAMREAKERLKIAKARYGKALEFHQNNPQDELALVMVENLLLTVKALEAEATNHCGMVSPLSHQAVTSGVGLHRPALEHLPV